MASAAVMEPAGRNATLSSPQPQAPASSESLLKEQEAPGVCSSASVSPAGGKSLARADYGKETLPGKLCDTSRPSWKGKPEEDKKKDDQASQVQGDDAIPPSDLQQGKQFGSGEIVCNNKLQIWPNDVDSAAILTTPSSSSPAGTKPGAPPPAATAVKPGRQNGGGGGLPADAKVAAAEDSGTGSSLESSDKDRSESMHTEPSDSVVDDDEDDDNRMEDSDNEREEEEEESACEQDSQASADPPLDDDDMETGDRTPPTSRNPGSTSPSPSSGRSNPRVPRYQSIICTRKRVEQQEAEESAELAMSGGRRSRHASGDQSVSKVATQAAEDGAATSKMDDGGSDRRAKGGKRLGRGRGRAGGGGSGGGGGKRPRSLEPPISTPPTGGRKARSPGEVSPPVSAAATAAPPASKRSRTRASPAKPPGLSPVRAITRATAAEMKQVQFLSLPGGQRKRRRRGAGQHDEEEDDDDEEDDTGTEAPIGKKNKSDKKEMEEGGMEEGEGEAPDDKELDNDKDPGDDKDVVVGDDNKDQDSRGRGSTGQLRRSSRRGRRGRSVKAAVAPPTLTEPKPSPSSQPEEDSVAEEEAEFAAKETRSESDASQEQQLTAEVETDVAKGKTDDSKSKGRKKRGRPPRRPKEDSAPSPAVAEDDMDVALRSQPVPVSEPLKNPAQIVELLRLSETMEGGRVTPPERGAEEEESAGGAVAEKPSSGETVAAETTSDDAEPGQASEMAEDKATTVVKKEEAIVVSSSSSRVEGLPPTLPSAEDSLPVASQSKKSKDGNDGPLVTAPSSRTDVAAVPADTVAVATRPQSPPPVEQPVEKETAVPREQEEGKDGHQPQAPSQQPPPPLPGEVVKSPEVDVATSSLQPVPPSGPVPMVTAAPQPLATTAPATGFPFPHQYEQGPYPPPPPPHPMHPMHLFPHSYPPPPFTGPPYPYMVPASPSFSPYPQEHCMPPPPHGLYQGYHEDIQQYPPRFTQPSSSTSSPSPVTEVTTGTFVPAHSQEPMATSAPSPVPHVATPPGSHPCTPMPPHSMEMPHPLGQPYAPHPSHMPGYAMPPPHAYNPHPMLPPPMVTDWTAPHGPPTQRTPPIIPATTVRPATKPEPRFPLNFYQDDNQSTHPVDCPECGRQFKNNKALNGHMRLHGGFDWTRKAIQQLKQQQPAADLQQQQQQVEASSRQDDAKDLLLHGNATATSCKPPSEQKAKGQASLAFKGLEGGVGSASHKGGRMDQMAPTTPRKHKGKSKGDVAATTGSSPPRESHFAGTLDDLCRAAEELERIEKSNDLSHTPLHPHHHAHHHHASHHHPTTDKPRPTPLILPHERRFTQSPPYTPPPILSPARSISLLTGPMTPSSAGISTPNKIMWRQRTASENAQPSDLEEPFTYSEPKINVGPEFQAELPKCNDSLSSLTKEHDPAHLSWKPLVGLSQEEEDTIDGYLELACSPAIPHGGRNKELALHILHQTNGSIKEAVRLLVMGKTPTAKSNPLSSFNYSGSKKWSARDRQQFRRAWRVHRKQFHLIRSAVENKALSEIVEFYYSWKKYCPDEYRGRNRHASEEILSEEDDHYPRPASATSSSSSHSSASNDLDPSANIANSSGSFTSAGMLTSSSSSSCSTSGGAVAAVARSTSFASGNRSLASGGSSTFSLPTDMVDHHLPKSLLHQSRELNFTAGHIPVQEYRCKYPGCNQVYTSIFALNGHIRIHGGSWYPKKPDVESGCGQDGSSRPHLSSSGGGGGTASSVPGTNSSSILSKARRDREEGELRHQLEIAKTMVIDLAQPRSPAHVFAAGLTPSPRPSPTGGRNKSSLVRSKKACSSSPHDRDGHYPCNRCGRVFSKVKSRSAHMKSHIMKQQ